MFKVTGVEGEHMTREQTLDGVEAIIGKLEATPAVAEGAPAAAPQAPAQSDDKGDEAKDEAPTTEPAESAKEKA